MNKQNSVAIIGHGVVGKAFERMVQSRYQVVTYDPAENKKYPKRKISNCGLVVICVPTPLADDNSCDISIVENAVSKLSDQLILIKSTVAPGTTDMLIKKYGREICFSPEYIGESSYYHPYWKAMEETPFLILGGQPKVTSQVLSWLEPILGPTKQYFECKALEAELIKYMENCFFATKVTFVNEFYEMCQKLKINWHKVREGWLLDERINRMHTSVFETNRGFGGKCYPKDLAALIISMQKLGYEPELLKQVQASNNVFRKMNAKKK